MKPDDITLPFRGVWTSPRNAEVSEWTFTQNPKDPERIDAQWHPADSDADKRLASQIGTRWSAVHTKLQLSSLIERGILVTL